MTATLLAAAVALPPAVVLTLAGLVAEHRDRIDAATLHYLPRAVLVLVVALMLMVAM